MTRKPLPKAITRSIASLRGITAGFAADEQGRVPRRQPFCGPLASNDWARENETPRRTSRAPATR